jgi:hypothetical protein
MLSVLVWAKARDTNGAATACAPLTAATVRPVSLKNWRRVVDGVLLFCVMLIPPYVIDYCFHD